MVQVILANTKLISGFTRARPLLRQLGESITRRTEASAHQVLFGLCELTREPLFLGPSPPAPDRRDHANASSESIATSNTFTVSTGPTATRWGPEEISIPERRLDTMVCAVRPRRVGCARLSSPFDQTAAGESIRSRRDRPCTGPLVTASD